MLYFKRDLERWELIPEEEDRVTRELGIMFDEDFLNLLMSQLSSKAKSTASEHRTPAEERFPSRQEGLCALSTWGRQAELEEPSAAALGGASHPWKADAASPSSAQRGPVMPTRASESRLPRG